MPSAVTTYGATYFLGALFGQRTAPPPYFYIALCTQAPGTQADGSQLTEPDIDAGYYRVMVPNDNTGFGQALDGVVACISDVIFPVATADWPTITHYALCDDLVAGQVYLYGNFTTPRRILFGDQAHIPDSALSLSLSSLTSATSSTF